MSKNKWFIVDDPISNYIEVIDLSEVVFFRDNIVDANVHKLKIILKNGEVSMSLSDLGFKEFYSYFKKSDK